MTEVVSVAALKEGNASRLYLSVADAMQLTGLGRTTLYQLMNDGVIESFTIGRRRLIVSKSLGKLHQQAAESASRGGA